MITKFNVNGNEHQVEVEAGATLLNVLRDIGYFGVKHGCETGECGACAILIDGKLINSCVYSAMQTDGKLIETIESVGEHPDQGWKKTEGLHPIQKAFAENGSIQCGYCTPAMVLAAKELIAEKEVLLEQKTRFTARFIYRNKR
jgi:putative selenate reductase molybdopterin-binding subunit